ncbi:MAG: hypothetical protein J2P58_13795 [Acidimicrobiaceae bacterium]|nr:hypothetical protein [Acidimicrobiaceae bacterium]
MPVVYDEVHRCPACGAPWKVPIAFPKATKRWRADEVAWYVVEGGWCADASVNGG